MTSPDPTQDPATAELERIRERWSKVAYVGLKPEVVPEPGHQPSWLADIPHLLAAVEAVLALADKYDTIPAYGPTPTTRHEVARRFREAITAALSGKEASNDT